MANTDFSVLVHKLLSYLNESLQKGRKVTLEELVANTTDFPISEDYWRALLQDLLQKGLIAGVAEVPMIGGSRFKETTGIRITMDGAQYLSDNPKMKQVRELLGPAASIAASILFK